MRIAQMLLKLLFSPHICLTCNLGGVKAGNAVSSKVIVSGNLHS